MNYNLKLRPWQISDIKSLAENANDTEIWNRLRDYIPNPYSEKDAEDFIKTVSVKNPQEIFAIVIDGKAVGSIGIIPNKDVERITVELGYWLGRNYWGQGIMTQAVKQMCEYAFANFAIHKIYATPFDFNIGSQRVLEKAGFEREAILKQAAIKNGKIIDLHYYGLIKE